MTNTYLKMFLFIIASGLLLGQKVAGKNYSYSKTFNQIAQKDGLPNNLVECLVQDHIGYMWFGTKRGLSRYDGYDFKNYKSNIDDPTSLPYHHITALLETSDSTLWVGVWRNGLCKYNRVQDNFSMVDLKPTIFPKNLEIKRIFEDSKKRIWLLHNYGITVTTPDGKVLKDVDRSNFKGQEVSAIYEKRNKEIIIAAGESIYSYNNSLQTLKKIQYSCNVKVGSIYQFYQFNNYTLWLASDYGLLTYDMNMKTISPLLKSNDGAFKFIFEDAHKNIWTGGNYPIYYERYTNKTHHFNEMSEQYGRKSGNSLTCGIMDSQQNFWFGNTNIGVNVLYNKSARFDYYPRIQKYLKENAIDVTAILRDKEGMLFIGTTHQGFLLFDKNENRIEIQTKYPGLSNIERHSGVVRDIKSDNNENLWFGCGGGTKDITIFNPSKKSYENYNRSVSSFLFDSKGNTWIGEAQGLSLFDSEKKQFKTYHYKNVPIRGIADMQEDNEGNIWIASHDNGFFLMNIFEKKLIKANKKFNNLPDTKGITILRDSKGRMWLGSEFYGLFYKDSEQNEFKQFTQTDGLPSNDICSLVEDNNGNIWIGTNHGLSRYNYSSGRFKNYYINDGLSGDEFNFNALFLDDHGVILLGTTSGLVAFDPDKIEDNEEPLPLVIKEVSVNNKSIITDLNGRDIGEALINQKPVILNHNQNTVGIKFSTINLTGSKKSQFAYMLKGSDDDFQYVGEQRQVNYTKLPPGDYKFIVKASNNDNVWSENEATFLFKIKQHPLKGITANILYFIFLCLLTAFGIHIVRYQNRLKNEVFLEKMAKRQQDDLVKMKLRFFTNISHGFKTPLSLIISPLEELIDELHGNSAIKKKLKQIRNNSQRLLSLINQLIEFRKMEQDVLPVKNEELNLLDIARNEMSLFHDAAELRNIHFELKTAMQECRVKTDKDKIEKIFNNLLSNAFKHTPENGTITVTLTLIKNQVEVSIKDTGAGISEHSLEHVFDRFYQEEHTDQISGIGLAYVKKIVELVDGSIEVKSEINKGTEVIFTIPNANQMPVVEVFNQSNASEIKNDELDKNKSGNKSKDEEPKTDAPRILVVEDDFDMRKHLYSLLKNAYNVDEAENGEAGLKMIQKTDYNLVLSDIMMPKMDGLELCAGIKSNPKTNHIIVIMLSAKDEVESEMEGYKTGANIYLSKPFQPKKLLSIIKNQLSTQQKAIIHHADTNTVDQDKFIGVNQKEKEFIEKVARFIEKNLHKNDFGIERIVEEFGLSRSNLYKKFKMIANVSPKDFIKELRMKKAAALLKENNLTASEIAYDLGFNSATNFFTAFKAYYGKTPKEFRQDENG